MEVWHLSYRLPNKAQSEVLILYLGSKNGKYCGIKSEAFTEEAVKYLKAISEEWKHYSGKMRYNVVSKLVDINKNYREYKIDNTIIMNKYPI